MTKNKLAISSDGAVLAVLSDSGISLYQYILGSWEEMNSNIPLTVTERWDDVRLSADGKTIAISTNNGVNVGALHIFRFDGTTWIPMGDPIVASSSEYQSQYVQAFDLSDDGLTIAVVRKNLDNFFGVDVYKYGFGLWSKIGEPNYRDNGYWSPEMVSLSKDGLSYAIGFQYHNYASSGEADPIIEVYSLIDNVPPSLSSSIQSEIDEGTQSIGTVGADESVTWSVLGDGISIDSGGVISLDLPADYETKNIP